ncbi:hypothetical protein MMC07_003335 [Pseudocyphellaria aurata]|nr:hypothetical protein [Pseudocyphellaria aurata]
MADPFEVRMRFTHQLQHLNASINSSQKAAHYALKYRDMDEDLHSCILEQLERVCECFKRRRLYLKAETSFPKNSMNNRANIMYFIEHLCDMAQRENHLDFVRMIQRDILRVVDAVAPSDGSGAANVKVVRRVLNGLQNKSILVADTVVEIEACLKERDTLPAHPALSPVEPNTQRDQQPSQIVAPKINGVSRLDKRQIEQRIEEDRERHKRLRENIWAVNDEDDPEFDRLWDDVSDIGEDDYIAAEEDAFERRQAVEVE